MAEEYHYEDIAQVQGITRERVRQKETKALKQLKHPKLTRQIKDFFYAFIFILYMVYCTLK
ncbi:MAG: sigma factor-like helix-turn-helix DNA-binding protein [Bacilli bacterium]